MYGKVFTEIFDSSLMADGGWLPTYIFMCMVSFADKNGHLRHDPRTLYRRIGLSVDERVSFNEFMDAIEFLEREDAFSNLPAEQGKRIIPAADVDEINGNRGWFLVNYIHYRDKGGSIEQRREQDAERKRQQRERENNNLEDNTPESHVTVTAGHGESAHIDIDTDIDKKRGRKRAPKDFKLTEKLVVYAKDKGMDDTTIADQFEGFMDWEFKSARKDWPACWRTWCRRWKEQNPGKVTTPFKHRKQEPVSDEERQRDRNKANRELADLKKRAKAAVT